MTDASMQAELSTRGAESPWWRSAVVYQVYIRSFADGDGDGVGDIAGLRSRLPYLAALGVDAVWINPWYPSPMKDAGYDVSDFRAIEPVFGTLADAEAMIAEAHGLGIRVLLDLVPNHVSDQHRWFQQALAAAPGSAARARFIFRDGRGPTGDEPPNDWVSRFGGAAWTRVTETDGRRGQWYLHLFTPEQPDLDWNDQTVQADFEETMHFWFGLSGGSTASASMSLTAWSRPKASRISAPRCGHPTRPSPSTTRTGIATPSMRSTASGGAWPTPTTIRGSSWQRRGCKTPNAWRCTCAATNCTPRSTSISCSPPGRLTRCGRRSSPRSVRTTSSGPRPRGSSRTTTR